MGLGRVVVLLALCACLACCAAPYAPSHPPVPPPLPERVTAPPPSNVVLIWRPGHYDWTGRSYAWTPGQWVPRAGHGTLWQDGYWERYGGTFQWIPAHWL